GAAVAGALGISENLAIVGIGAAVIFYVVLGGIWAATLTDLVQFSWILLVNFIAIPVYLLIQYGLPDRATLPDSFYSVPFGAMPVLQLLLPSVFTFILLNLSIANQAPYFARAAATISRRTVRIAWTMAFVIALLTGIAGSLTGIWARSLVPDLDNPELAFGTLLGYLPLPLTALALAGLMAATMSTVDMYLVSGVNQLIRDVAQLLLGMRDSQQLLRYARWATLVYGALTVIFAVWWTEGLTVLFGFGTAIGAPLFVFFLDSWLLRVGNGPGALASVVASLLTVLVWELLTDLSTVVHTLAVVFPVSFITLVVVSLLFRTRAQPVESSPEARELSRVQKEVLEAVAKGYQSAADIVDFCGTREAAIQLTPLLRDVDYLIEQGYLRRQGERLTKQLYFDITPEGKRFLEEEAADVVDVEEIEATQTRDLSREASAVLEAVKEKPGATTVEVAHRSGLSLEMVTPTVNVLENKGLVRIHGLITPRVSPE
ncbi:MAG: hypothetical protein M3283_05105, partial [Actinomycetota bacterium]|nr:hypothetical protein [Actinomycetota bacterium]